MTVKQVVKEFDTIPTRWETDGKEYKTIKGSMADGTHSLMVWEMWHGQKKHLHYITYGDTEKEAEDKMKQLILR